MTGQIEPWDQDKMRVLVEWEDDQAQAKRELGNTLRYKIKVLSSCLRSCKFSSIDK